MYEKATTKHLNQLTIMYMIIGTGLSESILSMCIQVAHFPMQIMSRFCVKLTRENSEFRKFSVCEWNGVDLILFSMRLNSRLITDGRTRTLNVVRVGDVEQRAVYECMYRVGADNTLTDVSGLV